ncbi:MAG: hypothetical protein Q8K18_16610 [Burkholderiales bacterium]|nr:hypothetical protein [Burkholderiales bacterium]
MNCKGTFLLCVAAMLVACQGEPRWVYVPATEPEVELLVRASATEVSVGEPVVLHAERRSRGEWKQVEKSSLTSEQCWLGRPPPAQEKEVSDNVRWEALPAGRARFNTVYRDDHTREVVFLEAGTFTLESSTEVWCRPDKARGQPIKILVRDKIMQ